MKKTIILRGKKELVGVYNRYARISGKQDTGRPQSTIDFVTYVASLPLNEDTMAKLNAASIASKDIGEGVDESYVPTNIKVTIEIDENIWTAAISVFKYCFKLAEDRDPQMPYFIKVAGTACITEIENKIESKKVVNNTISLEKFSKLDVSSKLDEIYRLLTTERR